jgi:hypothetical protein
MLQITRSGRTVAGGFVAFDIAWEGELPPDSAVLWSMEVTNQEGTESVDLGYQHSSGVDDTQFVDAQSSGRREEVPADADLSDGEITVRFPTEVVGVAVEWPVWKAVIVVDGSPVASEVVTLS